MQSNWSLKFLIKLKRVLLLLEFCKYPFILVVDLLRRKIFVQIKAKAYATMLGAIMTP